MPLCFSIANVIGTRSRRLLTIEGLHLGLTATSGSIMLFNHPFFFVSSTMLL